MNDNISRSFDAMTQAEETTPRPMISQTTGSVRPNQKILLLGEILSASGLVKDDQTQSFGADSLLGTGDFFDDEEHYELQPFATVKFGSTLVHETKCCKDGGANPIWTLSTRSLFLIKTTPNELSRKHLDISLWTKRTRSAMDFGITDDGPVFLGSTRVEATTVLENCITNEQRVAFDLTDDIVNVGWGARGSVTLRFRLASPSDERFVNSFNKWESSEPTVNSFSIQSLYRPIDENPRNRNSIQLERIREFATLTTEADETEIMSATVMNAISSAFTLSQFFDHTVGQIKYKVKPGPDPDRKDSTAFLSRQQIYEETLKPSKEWIEAGSGTLGKLYLEILSCHGLPNMDVGGESLGNVTDAFICAVFEDAAVQTCVIDDELSPHWLPWTTRAFIFGIMNPASMLYIGCFDYDLGADHESIGRVAVNICNLQSDTEYTLSYNLHASSNVTDRTANGTITIRIRVEIHDEKAAILAVLQRRQNYHINCVRERSIKCIKYTCYGEYGDERDPYKFDLTVFRSHINEILEIKRNLGYLAVDAMESLIFWRGQVRMFGMLLPLHSFLFFCATSTVVEHPQLLPALMILSVAWVMLAIGIQRQQHPSPWFRCPSFSNYLQLILTGQCPYNMKQIAAYEGSGDSEAYNQSWKDRLERDMDAAARRAEQQHYLKGLRNQNDFIDDTDTFNMASRLIPAEWLFKLGRIQGLIGQFLRHCRLVRIIVTWEESIISFWVTAIFLGAGMIALLLPWTIILTFLGRCVVWGLFGPHMMIVDAYLSKSTREEKALLHGAMKRFRLQNEIALAQLQETTKLKDVKSMLFGEYMTRVPNFNLSRHYDRPLPKSFARVSEIGPIKLSKKYFPGQQLFGSMIPRPEEEARIFEKEHAKLKILASETQACVAQIIEARRLRRMMRLELVREASAPGAQGYEMAVLGERDKGNTTRDSNSKAQVTLNSSSTLELDENAEVALLSVRCQKNRQSVAYSYGMLHFDPHNDCGPVASRISESFPSNLEVCGENKLAIIDAKQAENYRRIFFKGRRPRSFALRSIFPEPMMSTERESKAGAARWQEGRSNSSPSFRGEMQHAPERSLLQLRSLSLDKFQGMQGRMEHQLPGMFFLDPPLANCGVERTEDEDASNDHAVEIILHEIDPANEDFSGDNACYDEISSVQESDHSGDDGDGKESSMESLVVLPPTSKWANLVHVVLCHSKSIK